MAVLAEYHSGNENYARSANAAFSGFEEGQSMMARAQTMQQHKEQFDQQRQEFQAKLPAIQAESLNRVVQAKASIDNAVTNTNLETKAAAESVQAVKDFNDAIQHNAEYDVPASDGTPEGDAAQAEAGKYATQKTYEDRIAKLSALKAKYAYMANLKNEGYQAFYQSIDKALAQNNDNLHINLKIDELQAAAQARADALRYGADTRYAGTVYGADARTTQTGMNNVTSRANAQTSADARVTAAQANRDKNYEFERTIELRNQAIRENDNEAAQLYQDRLNKMNTTPNSTSDSVRPLPSSVPNKKTTEAPAAPAAVSISIPGSDVPGTNNGATEAPAANAPVLAPVSGKVTGKPTTITTNGKTVEGIEVGGKTYEVKKDKNGIRAYFADGHWITLGK